MTDFDHLGRIADVPMTLVSKTGVAAKDVKELIDWIVAEQGKVTYGHAGIGSASHLCTLVLMKELKLQMVGVGYRGTGPAMNDLLGGQFDVMCDQTTNTTNQIKEGRIKGYAVTTKTKVSSLPDLPTLDSTALPGFEVTAWHAMWAPKGLPKDATDKLVAALQAGLERPEGDRALRRSRHRAGAAKSRHARGAEIANHIGSQTLGRRDQGGGRQGQLSLDCAAQRQRT